MNRCLALIAMEVKIEINEMGINFCDIDSEGITSNHKFFFYGSYNWDEAPISIGEIIAEGASQLELRSLRDWCEKQVPRQ